MARSTAASLRQIVMETSSYHEEEAKDMAGDVAPSTVVGETPLSMGGVSIAMWIFEYNAAILKSEKPVL